MAGIFGMEALHNLASAAQAKQVERIAAFDMYEQGLIAHVRDNMPQPAPVQVPVPVMEPRVVRPTPLRLKVTPYNGKEGENLFFWVRETELAMEAGLVSDERLRVAFALSNLSGRAKSWAYAREVTTPGCFNPGASCANSYEPRSSRRTMSIACAHASSRANKGSVS